jgi:hypothetical protein
MDEWHFGPTFSSVTEFEHMVAKRLRQIDRQIEEARAALMSADEIGVLLRVRASIAALADS